MQKVEGSNPFSRFRKGLHLPGLFHVSSRLVRLRRVGLNPDSRPADRRRFQRKRTVCRPIPARPNRSPSAGPQKVKCSARRGRTPALPASGTFLRSDACRPDISDPSPRERVRSQSGNRKVDLDPAQSRQAPNPWREVPSEGDSFGQSTGWLERIRLSGSKVALMPRSRCWAVSVQRVCGSRLVSAKLR